MKTHVNVVFPKNILAMESPDIVYLLHGLSDNADDWMTNTQLTLLAEHFNLVFILPEVQRSFYTDMAYGMQYFTFLTEELPMACEKMFGLEHRRENTYIMGLSMGGHGALKCALKKPEQYAGCAAFSAAIWMDDLIEQAMGNEILHNEMLAVWGIDMDRKSENDVLLLAQQCAAAPLKPRIFMTCGTEDFIYSHTEKFRNQVKDLGYDFTYREWPGEHEWYLWNKSLHLACEHFFDRKGNAAQVSIK